jgi:hypothetical protein
MNDMHDDGISRLYQKSRIEEPPMGLDSAILTRARKAVEKKKSLWCRVRWMVPLTSFALAMLTATLFIQMKQEHPEILAPSSVISPAPELQTEEGLKDDLQRDLKKRKVTEDKEQTEKRDAAAAPAPAMELKSAPAEMEVAPARKLMKQKREAVGASQFRSRENLLEADSVAAPKAEALKAPLKSQAILDPEAWIVKIRTLLEQKKRDEAIKELEAFKTAYPDYQLPADLKVVK